MMKGYWRQELTAWSLLQCGHNAYLPPLDEVIFQDIQAAHHLGEDEDFVATCNQFREQFINQYQLSSCLNHGL